MFGHDTKDTNQSADNGASGAPVVMGNGSPGTPPSADSSAPTVSTAPEINSDSAPALPHPSSAESSTPQITTFQSASTAATATTSDDLLPSEVETTDSPTSPEDKTEKEATPAAESPAENTVDDNSHLLDLKKQALQELAPLVSELDQTPEETFHTLMMMIQASDNQSLIQNAYDSADKITDKKAKAQAFLDIVNEINYFTHSSSTAN